MSRIRDRGKIRLAVAMALGVVLVLVGAAVWFWNRSESRTLRPLVREASDEIGHDRAGGRSHGGAEERYPGRRRIELHDAPNTDVPELGSDQQVGDGHEVRVSEYQPTLRATVESATDDLVVDAVRVEACAGRNSWNGGALAAAYHLAYPRPSGGLDLRPAASGLAVGKPPLSTRLAGEEIRSGDCKEGWVVFVLGTTDDFDDRLPTSIVFDNTAFGFVPDGGKGRAAWRIR